MYNYERDKMLVKGDYYGQKQYFKKSTFRQNSQEQDFSKRIAK